MGNEFKTKSELMQEISALNSKLEELEKNQKTAKQPHPKSALVIIGICCLLGIACIVSVIAKSWLGQPHPIDWFLALIGVVLTGFSLFRTFELNKDGLKVEMADIRLIQNVMRNISNLLDH